MKRKFLITNDVGLAQDKVNSVVSMLRTEDGFDYNRLDEIDETLIEVLGYLEQALENLGDEE